jgi:diguanylate cyclase (GGDEF)-like protein
VLIHVARLMDSSIRASDWLGRYGGEEFLVIASEAPGSDATQLAERLRLAVEANPFTSGELTISPTISIGIANSHSIECPTPEALVRIADAALYRAKDKGRNRSEVDPDYSPTPLKSEGYGVTSLNSVTH